MKQEIIWHIRQDDDFYKSNQVHIMNATPGTIIVRNIFMRGLDGYSFITFRISPFQWSLFTKTCNDFFNERSDAPEFTEFRHEASFKWTEYSFQHILAMLKYLNGISNTEEFTEALLSELNNINRYFSDKNTCSIKEHLIPSQMPHIPSSKNTIITLFRNHEKKDPCIELEINLKKLLIAGENPDQKSEAGETPLGLAVRMVPMNTVENLIFLLLCYGANPWNVSNLLSGYSAIEEARQASSNYAPFEAWLKSPVYLRKTTPIRVDGIDMVATKKALWTTISLNNETKLCSELKSMQYLEHQEKMALFPLYSEPFNAVGEAGDILESFEHAFSHDCGKLIDIIRNQDGKIIGADVFIVRSNQDSIFVYMDLSFLHPDYRGAGLMPLIDYRLPFAIQDLYGGHRVTILFFAASYQVFRRIENTLFFPKYQLENMAQDIQGIFSEVFSYPLQWNPTSDGVYWTVKEEHQISVTPPTGEVTPMQRFYFQHLCGSQKNVYAAVVQPPGLDLLYMLHAILAPRAINFLAHCRELATLLLDTEILEDLSPSGRKKPSGHVYDSREMFFNGKLIPVSEKVVNEAFSEPPMPHRMNAKL